METARLLIDPALRGPENMARDEALLQACAKGSTITLRFYAWSPATVSLGYFQDYEEFEHVGTPISELPVVRRTTGGGAILHDLEVTYSLVLPADHPLIVGRPNRLYELAHQAIIVAVGHGVRLMGSGGESGACGRSAQRGPFFCFERRHELDVVVDDPLATSGVAKLAGSAQRRRTEAVLQHGSIMLDSRYVQQPMATWRHLLPSIRYDDAVDRLAARFEQLLAVELIRSDWRVEELASAAEHEQRYAGGRWTVGRER